MRIKQKMVLWFSGAITGLLLLMGIVIYLNLSKTMEGNIKTLAGEVTASRAETVARYLEGIKREMKTEAEQEILKSMDKNKIVEELKKRLVTRTDTYDNFFIADIEGNYISTNDKTGNITDRKYFQEIVSNKKDYFISEALISKSTGKPMFVLAHAVKNENGDIIGVLGNNISLDTISKIAEQVKIGDGGYGWICDKNGLVFAHPSEEIRMKMKLSEAEKFGVKISKEAVDRIINNEIGIEQAVNANGLKTIIINKKIPNTDNWTFAITVSEKEIFREVNNIAITIIILTLIIILAVIIISLKIAKSITMPISAVVDYAGKMAEGDFSSEISKVYVDKKDEIGVLSKAFEKLSNAMKEMIGEINKSSINLASSSTEMSSQMKSVADGAADQIKMKIELEENFEKINNGMGEIMDNIKNQVAGLEEVSSSIAEMSQTSNHVAKNAEVTMIMSENTVNEAKIGGESVRKTLEGIVKIETLVKDTEEKVIKLSNSSEEIGEIVKTIEEIAGQTNLLALNAAIEAAHAGDAGKGFAVVAEEIKELAERSQSATKQIEKLIKGIQKEVGLVLEATKSSYEEVSKSSLLSKEAENNLKNIIVNIEKTNCEVANISKAMEDQATAVEEISSVIHNVAEGSSNIEFMAVEQMEILENADKSLRNISEIIEITTESTKETALVSKELAILAENLEELTSQFKIEENRQDEKKLKNR